MHVRELLLGKEETLLEVIDSNVLLLALLCENDLLDLRTEHAVTAEHSIYEKNRRLLQWLKESSQGTLDGFLCALRNNGQVHVANYIDGTPGDQPLQKVTRMRLRRIRAKLIEVLDIDHGLLDNLFSLEVINATDYESIRAMATTTERSAKLIDILMRGSEKSLQRFSDVLILSRQKHVADYLRQGEVLSVHVEPKSPTNCKENEETILTMLKQIISKVSAQNLADTLTEEQQHRVSNLLNELKSVIIAAQQTNSILLFMLMSNVDDLDIIETMWESGHLNKVIQELFCCLAGEDGLTVSLKIQAEDFQECRDGFMVSVSECPPSMMTPTSMPDSTASQDVETMQAEICQLRAQLDEMIRHKQKANLAFEAVKQCLETIGTDSQLSPDGMKALTEAKGHIEGCLQTRPGDDGKMQLWLNQQLMQTQLSPLPNQDIDMPDGVWLPMNEAGSHYAESYIGGDAMSVDTGFVGDNCSLCTRSSKGNVIETPLYPMNHSTRGRCIIINNEHFINLPRRRGSDVDVHKLKEIFEQLRFEVIVYTNQTLNEMLSILVAEANRDHSSCDCFVAAILTHGQDGNLVYGVDGNVMDVGKLSVPIKECRSLIGKPKIFIVEGSRGERFDAGVSAFAETDVEVDDESSNSRIPVEADLLYVYSTAQGYISWRNVARGSWFIQALYQEMKEMTSLDLIDLEQVLTRVRLQLACNFESTSVNPLIARKKQMPSVYSTLTKELRLPSLTEALA